MSPDMLLSAATSAGRTAAEPMMTTFAVAKQKRATRAKFAKVRTGCVTCKRRHVKCDETKPCCKNCLKWAGYCSGYESLESLQSSTASRSRATSSPSSSSATRQARASPPLHTAHSSPTAQPLHGHGWADDASSVSSTTFSGLAPSPPDISAELASAGFLDTQYPSPPYQPPYYPASAAATAAPSAVLDDAFWKQTMPRLVKESTAVRYANIAVHTLIFAKGPTIIHSADDGHHHHHNQYYQQQQHNHHHQSHHQHQHRRAVAGGRQHGPRTTADYYGRALTCYGLALSEARRTTDLREAILCAVFFVIFETINGDQAAAEAHLQSGQRILDELGMLRHVLQFLAVQARDFDRSDEIRHGIPLDEMPCEA